MDRVVSAIGRSIAGRRGFTLLELLVVIAIIALLVSVLLPALSSSKAEGAKTKCLGHMRSIGQACVAYSTDDPKNFTSPIHPRAEIAWIYDGEYEYGGATGLGVYGDPDFIAANRALNRFLYSAGGAHNTDFSLYQCPMDQGIPPAPVDFDAYFLIPEFIGKPVHEVTGTSFRLNNHIDFTGTMPPDYRNYFFGPYMRPVNRVPDSGATVLLEEAIAEVAKWNEAPYVTNGWHRKPNVFNVSFVDGHAAPIFLSGQENSGTDPTLQATYPGYWYLRGDNWRMDCWPDRRVEDRP